MTPLETPLKLDLGAGQNPRPGFIGVDRAWGDHQLDLLNGKQWPWPDGSVEELYSCHFIEHIPADEITCGFGPLDSQGVATHWKMKDRLFFFFDECYRILKPSGTFTLVWPALQSVDAFQDPTHRRFLPLQFLHYLSKEGRKTMCVDHYNVDCDFRVLKTRLTVNTAPGDVQSWSELDLETRFNVQKAFTVELIKV